MTAYQYKRFVWVVGILYRRQERFVFAPPIQDVANVVVLTISIFEVFKRTLIEKGRTDALEAVGIMYEGKVVDLDREIALSQLIYPLN